MRLVLDTDRLHVPPAVRAGIVIGTAIALAGITVGGIRGSTTNQVPLVYVANPSSSPVPVSVTNQTSAQTVTGTVNVGNFPSTQPVSGTVNVGNLPNSVVAHAFESGVQQDSSSTHDYTFGRTINITGLYLNGEGVSDSMGITLDTPFGGLFIHDGDGEYHTDFTAPIPATGVTIDCENSVERCDANLVVVGQ